jgi:quinolinate synthase
MGYDLDACAVYDPARPNGGLTADDVRRATFLLWKGHCYVHQLFTAEHIAAVRRRYEGIRVIVHPECPRDVVAAADAAGSTEQIIRAVAEAEPGSRWAIGTEANLVHRLARRHPEKFIRLLADVPAFCRQMGRIDLPHLAWVLDNLAEGRLVNRVRVDPATAAAAREALARMIAVPGVQDVTAS